MPNNQIVLKFISYKIMNQALSIFTSHHITINLIKSNNRLSTVIVKGSVNSPGEYALTSGNESLLS